MHRAVEDWQDAEHYALAYPRTRVEQFSPRSSAILEIGSERDLAVLDKMYANSVLLGDHGPDGWGIRYAREFDMTNDSKLFPPRPKWEERGYRPNEYGLWVGPDGDVALPLYEGRMIGQFDFSEKGWVRGKGRSAEWRPIAFDQKLLEPQFCMGYADYVSATDRDGEPKSIRGVKLGFMDVSSATNERTMIAALVPDAPCGNKVPVLATALRGALDSALCSILNSFVYDYQLRCRLGGLSLNYFIIEETAVPRASALRKDIIQWLNLATLRLCGISKCFAELWAAMPRDARRRQWRGLWAVTEYERMRVRCIVDAVVAELYGVGLDDLSWILHDCDHPTALTRGDEFTRKLNPKGFWRIDKERDPELRQTVLTVVAFHELKRHGLGDFLASNEGEGWTLPESLRLADYGLGHDSRAREAQPVTARLGPRFLPWQLEQGVAESWEECASHAERLEVLLGRPVRDTVPSEGTSEPVVREPTNLFGEPLKTDLFGNVVEKPGRRKRRGN